MTATRMGLLEGMPPPGRISGIFVISAGGLSIMRSGHEKRTRDRQIVTTNDIIHTGDGVARVQLHAGANSLAALRAAGDANLGGKIVVDVANRYGRRAFTITRSRKR
jgi:hypothetical protein